MALLRFFYIILLSYKYLKFEWIDGKTIRDDLFGNAIYLSMFLRVHAEHYNVLIWFVNLEEANAIAIELRKKVLIKLLNLFSLITFIINHQIIKQKFH